MHNEFHGLAQLNKFSHFSYSRDYILLGNFIVMVLLPFLVICTLNRKLYVYIRNNTSDAGRVSFMFIIVLFFPETRFLMGTLTHRK